MKWCICDIYFVSLFSSLFHVFHRCYVYCPTFHVWLFVFFFFIQAIFRSPCTPCHMASFFLSATSVTWHSLHSWQFCFLLSIFIEVKPLLTKVQLMYLDTWKHILHRYLFRFLHGMERFWQMKVKVRREEEGNFWTLYSLQEGMKAMGERGHGCSDEERRGQ